MHIEGDDTWAPGKTITYNINYSTHRESGAAKGWEVTGGSIIAVNDNTLDPVQLYPYRVTKIETQGDNKLSIQDANDAADDNIPTQILKIALGFLFPNNKDETYVKIKVKWDNVQYASIFCNSSMMGFSGLCGNGSEKLNFNAACLDNGNPILLDQNLTIIPTCANGGLFQFAVQQYMPNLSITWALPALWKIEKVNSQIINGTNIVSGSDYFVIRGHVNYGGNGSNLSGLATLTVTRPCDGGVSTFSHLFPGEKNLAHYITPTSLVICPYKEVSVPVTIQGGQGVEPYTYEWSKPNAGCGVANGVGCTSMNYTSTEILNENINVKITDANGCYAYASIPHTTIDPNSKWQAYEIFNNFVTEALAIDVNATNDFTQHTDIVTDQIGLPYYVAQNGQVYTYEYVTTPYIGWKNKAVTTAQAAKGPLAIYEPVAGNKTIYFANTNNTISKVVSSGGNWITSSVQNTINVARNIKVNSSNALFYLKFDDKIYSSINNHTSPIATTLHGTKFNITDKYVYYFNTSGQLEAIDYTTSAPYNPISFSSTNADSKVLVATNLTYFAWQTFSDIGVDVAGNVYYVGANNYLYQANAATSTLTKVSSTIKYNGFLGAGKQAGVVYASALDNNIYQFATVNGDAPVEISFVGGRKDWSIGTSDWSGWWRQSGAIHFRAPNVFYLSGDGRLKMISYNTNDNCSPNILRQSNEPIEPSNQLVSNSINDECNFSVQPNPVITSTTINYQLSSPSSVKIVMYNMMGELVSTIADEEYQEMGTFTHSLEYTNLKSGIYICQFFVNGEKRTQVKLLVN